ncbi:hypothetical protein C8J56DRAFT_1043938 [Mycena floridula]|nr:hypothetical protein C8J56DRAFT_1043938 [Mycena floridula]
MSVENTSPLSGSSFSKLAESNQQGEDSAGVILPEAVATVAPQDTIMGSVDSIPPSNIICPTPVPLHPLDPLMLQQRIMELMEEKIALMYDHSKAVAEHQDEKDRIRRDYRVLSKKANEHLDEIDALNKSLEILRAENLELREKSRGRSQSPKRRRKNSSSTVGASEDYRIPTLPPLRDTRGDFLPAHLDSRPLPFNEKDIMREVASASVDNYTGRVATFILKRVSAAANSTAPHLLSPAMSYLARIGWTESNRFSFGSSIRIDGNSAAPIHLTGHIPNSSSSARPHPSSPSPEAMALMAAAPAPDSFSLKLNDKETAAFFLYRARLDEIVPGLDVIKTSSGGLAIDLRQTRALLFIRHMSPVRSAENSRARFMYSFIAAQLMGIYGLYDSFLSQLCLSVPDNTPFLMTPFHYTKGTVVTMESTVRHWASCGATVRIVNDFHPFGKSVIKRNATRRTIVDASDSPNHVSTEDWKVAHTKMMKSIVLGSPPGILDNSMWMTSFPVVPIADRGEKPSARKNHTSQPRPSPSAHPMNPQIDNTAARLGTFSFSNLPSFIDASQSSESYTGVTAGTRSNIPQDMARGSVSGLSYAMSSSSVTGGPLNAADVDEDMKSVSNAGGDSPVQSGDDEFLDAPSSLNAA